MRLQIMTGIVLGIAVAIASWNMNDVQLQKAVDTNTGAIIQNYSGMCNEDTKRVVAHNYTMLGKKIMKGAGKFITIGGCRYELYSTVIVERKKQSVKELFIPGELILQTCWYSKNIKDDASFVILSKYKLLHNYIK